MRTISAKVALRKSRYAVITKKEPTRVYDLYASADVAERICADLNKRYGDSYEVAEVEVPDC